MDTIFTLPGFLAKADGATSNVASRSHKVLTMWKDWELVAALLGGTASMRERGQQYLPKRPLEEDEDYKERLKIATLFPAYAETTQTMAGRVFAEPLIIGEDVPDWIENDIVPNVDLQNRDLNAFCADWFKQAMDFGISHALVESPKTDGVETMADQQAQNIRPYAIRIAPWRIIGWRADASGKLTQVRIIFLREADIDEFNTGFFWQIRVYTEKDITTHETVDGNSWGIKEVVPNQLGVIPLVTLYTKRTGLMTAEPPLRDLAFLNAKHWASQSSLDSLLDTAMVPILMVSGIENLDKKLVIGAKHMVKLPTGGDMKFVEHTGKAIEAGRTALDSLKEEMTQSGARLLTPPTQNAKTATQAEEEQNRENSTLGSMVHVFEDAVAQLLDMIAKYRSGDTGGKVQAQPNLDPDPTPAVTMTMLLAMRNAGALSTPTLFAEAKRRGLIAEDTLWEDEQARIQQEGPLPVTPTPGATGATGAAA